jgi:class 3 adenylate cyclase
MAQLPAGTVTFVFTDLEGSTTLVKELGERYGEVLSQHRRIVRETFGASGGTEIDTQGDAFFYAFSRAREAVTASVDVQRAHAAAEWPEGATVRVRIGLHTGEPMVGEEGYHGLDVVRAARICTVARGGNVLLSETTRALVGSSLPEGVSVFPIGERRLKGIDEPERVFELDIEGVEASPQEPLPKTTKRRGPKPPGGQRESEFERRFEDFGQRLSESIQERVLRSLDRTLAKVAPPPPADGPDGPDGPDGGAIDELADRASEDRIRRRVEDALRASAPPPDSG